MGTVVAEPLVAEPSLPGEMGTWGLELTILLPLAVLVVVHSLGLEGRLGLQTELGTRLLRTLAEVEVAVVT